MTPEDLAVRIRALMASNPHLILYVRGHDLYAGYQDDTSQDVLVLDVEL